MLEDYSTPHGKRYFVNLSWVIPCCEQKLGIGAQAMCIACNDTSVIVINFRKSKTHAITGTYCTLITPHGVLASRPFLSFEKENFEVAGRLGRRPGSRSRYEVDLRE